MRAQLAHNQRQPIGRIGRHQPGTVLVINRGDIQECAFFDLVGFSAYSNACPTMLNGRTYLKAQLVGLPGTSVTTNHSARAGVQRLSAVLFGRLN